MATPPHLRSDTVFVITIHPRVRSMFTGKLLKKRRKVTLIACPVNGETHYNDVGLSHGIVHLADPRDGSLLGHCGVSYFDEHAIEVIAGL